MIKYFEGTVFNAPAQAIVNTVNTTGAMGAGIAYSHYGKKSGRWYPMPDFLVCRLLKVYLVLQVCCMHLFF